MSTTHPNLEQPRTPAPEAGVNGGTAIDWPDLKLPPINLYNVQHARTYPVQDPSPSRE